ncbi:MAG: hypothetical protein HOH04_05830 [Rhodospirillaceae bacterium]|jgi:membrane fusion protein, multidrug efflux system|nr:hypothetical protein [Rhodospirillaceae bacterium]
MAELKRKLLIIPPIVIAAAVLALVISRKQPPVTKPASELARAVRVVEVRETSVVPRITGFGAVTPGKKWSAASQVSGEVEFVHPGLQKGAILPAGTEIIRISPANFKLNVAQAEANIRASEARIREFGASEMNTREILKIERRALEIAESELDRQKKLLARGNVSETAVDAKTREILTQRKIVQELQNTLRLIPIQRGAETEQTAVYQAQLGSAQLDLDRTRIALPFDARVVGVDVEVAQFAQAGQTLATLDGVKTAEVEAQMSIGRFLNMAKAVAGEDVPRGITSGTVSDIVNRLGFEVRIVLKTGDQVTTWPARFARISDTIDPKTRTVGVIAVVDGPYTQAIPGKRPPLAKGLFVEMELRTKTVAGQLVVPRAALQNGQLHVVDADSRLAIRSVKAGLSQDDIVTISDGLKAGEKVVVSDLSPAVEGMLLKPQIDTELSAAIERQAGNGDSN